MVRVNNPNPRLVSKERQEHWNNPFMHGGHGGGHEGGNEHAAAGGVSRSAFLRDSAKALADRGYALSLRVLGSVGV
jgi:hypothetical protein